MQFPRLKFSKSMATKWLKNHNIVPMKAVHVTDNYLRYRITEPRYKYYSSKKTSDGVILIFGYLHK